MKGKEFFSSLDEIRSFAMDRGIPVSFDDDIQVLFSPVRIGEFYAPNALVIQPMEGCDATAGGSPTEMTFRRYRRFAAGGSGLIWFEATAVVPEGKGNPKHLYLARTNTDCFRKLVCEVHRTANMSMGEGHRPLCILQLTHAGRFSRPVAEKAPVYAARNPFLDEKAGVGPNHEPISDGGLDRLRDRYVEAAVLALEAGFDGVDIKACHHYLVSELLSAHTRPGKYGGNLERRARFLLETVERIRAAAGEKFILAVRLNIFDGIAYPYGFGIDRDNHMQPDFTEPLWLVDQLRQRGVKLVNASGGTPYFNPHVGRPFDIPPVGEKAPDEHPLSGVSRLLGLAAVVQKEFSEIAVVSTGYSWFRQFMGHAGAATVKEGGARLVGVGRMAFAYPDYARDLQHKGSLDHEKCCINCSMCTQIMRDGGSTGCVVRDKEVYGPIYRQGRKQKV
jgi:2,4-dienoyl-CoA reductase-like NADH-dependent reductase (Old Yellow Enzyme family)